MRTAAERRRKELAEADTRVKLMSDKLLAEKEQINEMSAKLRLQRTQMNENMFKREAETKKRIDECGAEIETKLEQKFAHRYAQMKEDLEVALRARTEIDWA
jgi:hypothetical protein